MKRLGLALVLAVSGCVSPPAKPAQVGMSVDQYRMTCPLDGMVISQDGDWVIGECRDKPGEYVEFKAGRITGVLTEQQMFERLADFKCRVSSDQTACRNFVLQQAAQHASQKAQDGRKARQAEWQSALSRMEFSINSPPAALAQSVDSATPMSGQMCIFSREAPAGMNKICYYDCIGTLVAQNQSAVSLCPLNISR